ncbi:acyltransferase family-domain-containing protein [Entophlyctis helioformis]|nr:acyltransferase family-domain-containing protein [Entophlyctis helioformis]
MASQDSSPHRYAHHNVTSSSASPSSTGTAAAWPDFDDANIKDAAAGMPTSSAVDLPPTPALATAPAQPAKKPAAKLAHFDGLRGVVAMTVVLMHFFQMSYRSGEMQNSLPLPTTVPLFFILSGRVITVSVLRSGSGKQLVSCFVRRPIRLLLPMMSIMLLDYLVMHVRPIKSLFDVIVQPIFFLSSGGDFNLITAVVWTLKYEYYGSNVVYFLTFILLQYPANPRARYTILFLVYLWFQWTHSWNTHFVAGLALADLAQHGYIERFKQWRYAPITRLAVAVFGCAVSFKFSWWNMADTIDATIRSYEVYGGKFGVGAEWWDESFTLFLYSLCFMFLLETTETMQRFYTLRPIQFFGHISFAVYLFHDYWNRMFDPTPYAAYFSSNSVVVILISLALWVVPLMPMSYVLTDVIDLPSVKVGRWIERVLITEPWDGRLETLFKFETPKPGTTTTTVYGVPIPKIDLMALRRFWDAYAPSFVRRPATAAYAPVRP